MADWKAKAEEECVRLGITDEKQRAFVFEHERRHAGMREMLAWAKINELMLEKYATGDDNPYVYNPKKHPVAVAVAPRSLPSTKEVFDQLTKEEE